MKSLILKIGLFVGGVAILAAAANFLFSEQTAKLENAIYPSHLKTLSDYHDFGSWPIAAGQGTYSFEVSNITKEPVEITKLYTSSNYAKANLLIGDKKIGPVGFLGEGSMGFLKETLLPNQTAKVEVIFDPAADGSAAAGLRESFVYLEDKGGAPLKFGIRALVTL